MANKTTSNPKLQGQSVKIPVQSQLTKIKKEEEEELWISGEELYTEGSSDEEECKMQLRSRRKINSIQSSRTSTANHSVDQRGHLPVSAETRTKSDYSVGTFKDSINEKQFVLKSVTQYDNTSSKTLSRSPSMEFVTTDRLSTMESSVSSMTKDFSDFSTEEDQIENTEISWKAKRGTVMLPNSSDDIKGETNKC
ncbi:PREDICTED: uncharacterized protein LOC108548907 isoform X1 [Eufriesea mexicana]|uniref:uncharacterized protein LOC108548907 isoform X1 n=1 Tax=Eufriesea mexicana TaxID=516756 RepID=UPI00083BADBB|nr:PREDICTED: uncharacterized protein LOC108548907 isoform X1 [Eufriesea mexicana]XP_017757531.1 PREDICTED: uncharacterized protein LOC108548907 isoform X1 [Eufriesea mexicana]